MEVTTDEEPLEPESYSIKKKEKYLNLTSGYYFTNSSGG